MASLIYFVDARVRCMSCLLVSYVGLVRLETIAMRRFIDNTCFLLMCTTVVTSSKLSWNIILHQHHYLGLPLITVIKGFL